jgi:hypothetical protein
MSPSPLTRRTAILAVSLVVPNLAAGAMAPVTPVPLADTASPAARMAAPDGFQIPPSSGRIEVAAGSTSARIEDKVARERPTTYLFRAPGGRYLTFGVSSPKQDVRFAVFPADSDKAFLGAGPRDGAVRLTTSFAKETELRLVALTEGAETPFRFEVSIGGPTGD